MGRFPVISVDVTQDPDKQPSSLADKVRKNLSVPFSEYSVKMALVLSSLLHSGSGLGKTCD